MTSITIQPGQSLVVQDTCLHVLPSTQSAIYTAQQAISDALLLIADDKLVPRLQGRAFTAVHHCKGFGLNK